MAITPHDVQRLRCPVPRCREPLRFEGEQLDGHLDSGVLRCRSDNHSYGVRGGIPLLVTERDVSGMDALLRPIYDLIAPVHDAGVQYMLPLLQFPDPRATRVNYIEKLEIDRLPEQAEMPRFLEVGIGAAANVRLLDA